VSRESSQWPIRLNVMNLILLFAFFLSEEEPRSGGRIQPPLTTQDSRLTTDLDTPNQRLILGAYGVGRGGGSDSAQGCLQFSSDRRGGGGTTGRGIATAWSNWGDYAPRNCENRVADVRRPPVWGGGPVREAGWQSLRRGGPERSAQRGHHRSQTRANQCEWHGRVRHRRLHFEARGRLEEQSPTVLRCQQPRRYAGLVVDEQRDDWRQRSIGSRRRWQWLSARAGLHHCVGGVGRHRPARQWPPDDHSAGRQEP
jgi:hypothetical protein